MDSINSSVSTADVQGLPEHDKRELEQFIRQESQKATIQASVHNLTDMCFKKCITTKITSGTLDGREAPCMQNCVDRFVDANQLVLKQLDQMRGK